jgi:hypothetical protein
LLLLVEDVNKSGHAEAIVEKLASWAAKDKEKHGGHDSLYRILCPLWPGMRALLDEKTRKALDSLSVATSGFDQSEAREAVLVRSRVGGGVLTPLKAGEIAAALGNDPLLIALHDPEKPAEPHQVIGRFVEGACARLAAKDGDHAPADFRQALRTLAEEMLNHRRIDLAWSDISEWPGIQGERLRLISRAAHHGELLAFSGTSDAQRLAFRHDRVRDWLLADAAAYLDQQDRLNDAILSEPYFAEVIGAALVFGCPKAGFLDRVARANPLALFHALKYWGQLRLAERDAVLKAINEWLALPSTNCRSNTHLRWEALVTLAETDSSDVPALARRFPDRITSSELARLRNGDLSGGIELCAQIEPGVGAPWRDIQIEHAKLRYGRNLARALGDVLDRKELSYSEKSGALRLAGHFANSSLAPSIERCWLSDDGRAEQLADYLWAFAQCCADDPVRYLKPVCDVWASLPDEPPEDEPKKDWVVPPRVEVGADHLRWAFRRWPPTAALDYLVERGAQPELAWPMTCMLRGIDHPSVVRFIVHELAETEKKLEGTDRFSHFAMSAASDWRRDQEREGRSMSQASRTALREIWLDTGRDRHSRYHAFKLWAVTIDPLDKDLLRGITETEKLGDQILWHRLCIGDTQAIPALIEKLSANGELSYWWQSGRHIWSPELTETLGKWLERRRSQKAWVWGEETDTDWITSEMVMRLPESEGESLLLKNWDHLQFSPRFVQAALYLATPHLKGAADSAIKACPKPADLLKFISQHFGIRTTDRTGVSRPEQIRALSPYLDLMSDSDIRRFWGVCNEQGWFDLRRELLDPHVQLPFDGDVWESKDPAAAFDKFIAEKPPYPVSYWIDRQIETGNAWPKILAALKTWFDERKSIEALQIVATALQHRGTRQDLAVLRIYETMPEDASRQLIANTEFAVRRRTLH